MPLGSKFKVGMSLTTDIIVDIASLKQLYISLVKNHIFYHAYVLLASIRIVEHDVLWTALFVSPLKKSTYRGYFCRRRRCRRLCRCLRRRPL